MNDSSFLQSVRDDPTTLPMQAEQVQTRPFDVQVRNPALKRFHRAAVRCMAGTEATAQISGPACNLTTTPAYSTSRSLTPVRHSVPEILRDEWETLRLATPGVRRHFLFGSPLVNFFRRDPAAKAIDLLRTRLMQTLRANNWSRIAIAAPTHECGATFTAVNLAQSLARVPGSRTILMDINHRSPGIADMLEMDCSSDMRAYLEGDLALERHIVRTSGTLALGLIAKPCPDAAEILHNAKCAQTLDRMTKMLRPDVVLCDLPPILVYDDLTAFLPQIDAVLLVTDGTRTSANHIVACKRILGQQVPLLGVVLNRARKSGLHEYETKDYKRICHTP